MQYPTIVRKRSKKERESSELVCVYTLKTTVLNNGAVFTPL